MSNTDLVYTTYIKTTPEKLWNAITNPEFTRQYWIGMANVSDWKKGSSWKHVSGDEKGTCRVVGKVVESTPPKRLVLTWADPENAADDSLVTFDIQAIDDMVRLNVLHGDFKSDSAMKGKVTPGWPLVLSSMKSFLETGKSFNSYAEKVFSCAQQSAA